jgi:fructose/tagatose bisphosphate aldolase
MRSPVLLGFSGIYLPHPQRKTRDALSVYHAFAQETAARLTVPACLVFNESPHLDWVNEAIDLGFGLVMYTDETLDAQSFDAAQDGFLISTLQPLVQRAHTNNVAVEAEMQALPGVGGELVHAPDALHLTDANHARAFVAQTNVDALAVNVGQLHLHGRTSVHLDLERLQEIRDAVQVPLVLHGATSVDQNDLRTAIRLGVQKINVGSALKRTFFHALRDACVRVGADFNPYDVMGSGLDADVLTSARLALQKHVQEWMMLFGSAGKV